MDKVLEETMYEETKSGISMIGGDKVEIIGERIVEFEDGTIVEQYIYNIVGYTPKNGKPFVSLKANIVGVK